MKLRILHISSGLQMGGAERSLVNLLEAGLRCGADSHVISLTGEGYYGPLLREAGIPVYTIGFGAGTSAPWRILKLRQIVKDLSPAIVQGWMYHGSLAATLAASVARSRPAVCWNIRQSLYAITSEKSGTRRVIRAMRPLSRSPKAIIYNSHQARAHHEAFGFSPPPGKIIPNGFDTDRWRPDAGLRAAFRKRLNIDDSAPVLGFVGRLHPQKDVPTFLEACEAVMATLPDLHVVMVGEGFDEKSEALSSYRERFPRDRFYTLGPQKDVEAILPGFDFFCLSSSNEGFPNVLGEAMATALPCIATDVGDCARLMNGNGRIVRPGDVSGIAEAIRDFAVMDPAKRAAIGNASRGRIVAAYSLDATVDAYTELYESLIKRVA